MDAGWVLWPVAVLMAFIVAALVRWSTEVRTVVAAAVVVFLLAMMVTMFVGTAIYFSSPGTGSLVVGLWVATALMAGSAFPVLALVLRESHQHLAQGAAYAPRRLTEGAGLPALAATVTVLVLASELLMGGSFQLAAGGSAATAGGAPWGILATTVASPWFLFPMSLEMALTLAWLRRRLPGALAATLAAQASMMFFAPPALPYEAWLVAAALLTSGAMAGLLAYLLRQVYRGTRFGGKVRRYIVRFLLVSTLMGAGLAIWAAAQVVALFALAMVLQMAIFFTAIVVPESFSAPAVDPPRGAPEVRAGEPPTAP
jgi:hypothetical protein